MRKTENYFWCHISACKFMHAYLSVRELAPASSRKFILSPIVIKGFRKVKLVRILQLRICLGFKGDWREPVCHSDKNIRFQANMPARVLHTSILDVHFPLPK